MTKALKDFLESVEHATTTNGSVVATPPVTMIQSHAEWLAQRRRGLGASDIAKICNLAPKTWGGPLSVYLDKRGMLPHSDNPQMAWGRKLEAVVADAYSETTGRRVWEHPPRIIWSEELPWAFCTPDRLAVGGILVECKTAGDYDGWGPEGTDEIPQMYFVQAQWQLFCAKHMGVERVDVPVLIRGSDFRVYTVFPDPNVIASLVLVSTAFWQGVQEGIPPQVDQDTPVHLLNILHKPNPTKTRTLDEIAQMDADDYEQLGVKIRELEQLRDKARARLILALEDHGSGSLPDGRVIRRSTVEIKESVREAYTQTRLTVGKRKEVPLG